MTMKNKPAQRTGAPQHWRERISIDPSVRHGKPCIKGTRILVSIILDNLSAGEPEADIELNTPS